MAKDPESRTVRLSADTARLAADEARRSRRTTESVVVSAAEEALKTRLFPGIAFRGDDEHRRPWVIGTALDVWQVIEAYKDFGGDRERMAEETDLTERQLLAALDYYERFPEDVDGMIELNRRPLEELLEDHPDAGVTWVDAD
ncbi:MAG: hypothetical protein QOJ22_104 [Thermoleophilaceae bacterium]|jgi:uncharacterized protein (DUF433 family)|nr:hypothetical protein [Thermoleophilaceae bacterium]